MQFEVTRPARNDYQLDAVSADGVAEHLATPGHGDDRPDCPNIGDVADPDLNHTKPGGTSSQQRG